MTQEIFYRNAIGTREEDGSISISSDRPIDMGGIYEVLDHGPGAIDLSLANQGLSVLMNHNREDSVAIAENPRVQDGKLRVDITKWRSHTRAQDAMKDWENGALRHVSVGYARMDMEDDVGELNGTAVLRTTKWQPVEMSLVSIPADINVGLGRSKPGNNSIKDKVTPMPEETKERTFTDAEVKRQVEDQQKRAIDEYRDRVVARESLMDQHKLPKDIKDKIRSEDSDEATVLRYILEFKDRPKEDAKPKREDFKAIASQRTEMHQDYVKDGYNVGEAVRDMMGQNFTSRSVEIAREVSQTLGGNTGDNTITVPYEFLVPPTRMQRALYSDVGGTNFVPTTLSQQYFTDYLAESFVLMSLGAEMLTGVTGDLDISGFANDVASGWLPNEAADATDNDPASAKITLSEKVVAAITTIGNRMTQRTPLGIESLIRQRMMNKMNRDLQAALLTLSNPGNNAVSSIANAPKNIIDYTGASVLAGQGNNGDVIDYDAYVDLLSAIGEKNAIINPDSIAYVLPYQGKSAIAKFKDSSQRPLLLNDGFTNERFPIFAGEKYYVTNAVNSRYTRGTGQAGANSNFNVYCGDWSQLVMAFFGNGMEIATGLNGTDFIKNSYSIRTTLAVDVAPLYPQSFAILRHRRSPA